MSDNEGFLVFLKVFVSFAVFDFEDSDNLISIEKAFDYLIISK